MLRSGVGIVSQFKIEGVAGEGGAANRYIESLKWMFKRELDPKNFRGSGSRVNTVKVQHKRMATGSVEGVLDYNSFPYFCLGLFASGARAQIDTSGGYQQIFTAGVRTSDEARKTFAVEQGDSTACEDYAFAQLLSLAIEATQDEFTVKSDAIARYPEDNQTLAVAPTIIAPRPVERGDVNVYIDTSFANLGTTQLSEAQAESFNIPNKFKEAFFHNRSILSFADVVEIPYEPKFDFESAHNAQSRALVAALVNNPERWIRWEAQGNQIDVDALANPVYELIRIDLKILFDSAEELRNDDVPYAYKYGTEMMPDNPGLGTHLKITTINSLANL